VGGGVGGGVSTFEYVRRMLYIIKFIDTMTDNPNDMSCYFECGAYCSGTHMFDVPELARVANNKPVVVVGIDALSYSLYDTCWEDDLSPVAIVSQIRAGVIDNDHASRVIHAELKYPIIIDSQYHILDGHHRIAKYYLDNATEVNCVMLLPDDLEPIGDYIFG